MLTRKQLFGLPFISAPNCSVVVDDILRHHQAQMDGSNVLPLLITPNVDDVVKFSHPQHQHIAQEMKRAAYILPDGQFVVWSSKLLGKKLDRRLPGSDFFPVFWQEIKGSNKRILLIAPDERVGRQLQAQHNDLTYYVPPFFSEHDTDAVRDVISTCKKLAIEAKPDFILLGIRFPKQHLIALALCEMYDELQMQHTETPLIMLLGASFEFYLGIKKRAPRIFRFMGLEWFHRFLMEPRRLFKRFFIEDMAFFPIVWKELVKKESVQ